MKQSEVIIGQTYYTRIGEELAAVEVVAMIPGNPNSRWSDEKRTTYTVKRVGENVCLPKRRTAAALRKENKTFF